eukprot:gene9194-10154_t
MSDSVKRLAIARDGMPVAAPSIQVPNPRDTPLLTVMSNARDDFNSRYELIREVGKGGFSTVFLCRHRATGLNYAVKIIDLRPLRLRERFNPIRLKREVDIMRRLRHPNIIQFVEVYEDPDHLMMVMEYCPGKELFDVILARKHFKEEDARPIFAQVARAIFYLHTLHIIHRDIKPENVLVLDTPDPVTGELIVKLLDFGLSKNANGGSAAKTFVGTPCYLAPEVEYTSRGLGGTYGLPADCWSLGAVLYVMLVARFPEFEQDQSGKVVVKLPPVLWNHISSEAKDLIRGLMNTNPSARLTMASVLQHPWLGRYRATDVELTRITVANNDLSEHLQQEEEIMAEQEKKANVNLPNQGQEMTAMGTVVQQHVMVLRPHEGAPSSVKTFGPEQLQLAPLLHLQRSIATCFEEAHAQYQMMPEVAVQVRRGAVLCRQQLVESTKMLRKVEQTAAEVLEMFPDLELAVEEEEPQLAAEFFNIVKGWVVELREVVASTQKINKASMNQIQKVVEQSTLGLRKQEENKKAVNTISLSKKLLETLMDKIQVPSSTNAMIVGSPHHSDDEDVIALDANQVLELFMALFQSTQQVQKHQHQQHQNGHHTPTSPVVTTGHGPHESVTSSKPNVTDLASIFQRQPIPTPPLGEDRRDSAQPLEASTSQQSLVEEMRRTTIKEDNAGEGLSSSLSIELRCPDEEDGEMDMGEDVNSLTESASSPRAAVRLAEALQKLRQVDIILEQLGIFWANTEVVLDLLTKKGQHVEQFIGFSSKPRLMARFRERMEEYKRFWEGVRIMCANYVQGVQIYDGDRKMYGFLKQGSEGNGTSTSENMEKGDSIDSMGNSLMHEFNSTIPVNSPPHILEMNSQQSERKRR